MQARAIWFGGLAAMMVVGCGSDRAEVAVATKEQIQNRLPLALTEVTNETSAVVELAGGAASIDLIGDALDSVTLPDPAGSVPMPGPGPIQQGFRVLARHYLQWKIAPNLDGDTDGDRLVRQLLDEVFTDAAFEGDGVWRLSGELFCGETCSGSSAGAFQCMPDANCLARVAELELRVRVTLLGSGGLDFALLVGPGRDEVFDLALEPRKVELTFDLGGIKNAIRHVAMVLGEDVMLPRVLEGRVRFTLQLNGRSDVTLAASVDQAVRVEADSSDGPITASLAATAPAVSVRLRDTDPMLTAQVDVGTARLSAPVAEPNLRGRIGVLVAGLTGRTELPQAATRLVLSDLGLGGETSELTLDGARLVGVDVNPAAGRKTTLTITPPASPTGKAQLALEPGLQLVADLRLAALAAMGEMDVPSWAHGEKFTLDLTGPPTIEARERLLQIVTGRFSLGSSAAAAPVVVDAPGCLDARDAVTPDEHPLLGRFRSVPCR